MTPPANAPARLANTPVLNRNDSASHDREATHRAEAGRVLALIEKGGAYCQLRGLVSGLMSLSQPIAQDGNSGLTNANLKYRDIAMRLGALGPSSTRL